MYKKMLIPLDGSALAETVLPHALYLVRSCNISEVWLLQAVEPTAIIASMGMGAGMVLGNVAAQVYEQKRAEAAGYLEKTAGKLSQQGVAVKYTVADGEAGEAIIQFAEQNGVDLIIMATHGRSGVSRWVYGSIADKVLRAAKVPVLLVRATAHA